VVMAAIRQLNCEICGLPYHASSQCWFNGTLYDVCRRTGNLALNYDFRASIKLASKL
jgi:hypothetical protein